MPEFVTPSFPYLRRLFFFFFCHGMLREGVSSQNSFLLCTCVVPEILFVVVPVRASPVPSQCCAKEGRKFLFWCSMLRFELTNATQHKIDALAERASLSFSSAPPL